MALTQITWDDKESLSPQPSVAAKNKVTAGDMNEIKSVVNGACTQVDTNTGDISTNTGNISTLISAVNGLKGNVEDIVKLVSVDSAGFTLNANSSAELSITIPNQPGYKCLGCIGGVGNGNTGLLVSASTWYGDINRWVFNTSDQQKSYASASFILLYVKDINY